MMSDREIVAELAAAAHQEWAGIAILQTTHFEPELRALAPRAVAAAQRRVEALVAAARRIDPSVDLSAKGRAA